MACTKHTLVERITEDMDLEKSQARDAIETLLEIMKASLESGEDIMISGFGKFCINEKAARKGRNPATNSTMILGVIAHWDEICHRVWQAKLF